MSSNRIRVLLIEDNPGDARLLRELLRNEGESRFEWVHAESLAEAIRRLEKDRFTVILLDLSLPDAQGLQAVDQVNMATVGEAIVVLTGLDDHDTAIKALQRGAQDYLIKGQADGPLLVRALRYAIQRQRTEEMLKAHNKELSILREISETILDSSNLQSVLEQILRKTMDVGAFELGNIRLLEPNGQTLYVAASRGYRDPDNIAKHRKVARTMRGEQSIFGERMFKEACIMHDLQAVQAFRTLRREGIQSLIIVPIRARGEVLGIYQLAYRIAHEFTPGEVNLLETIGSQTGIAIQKAKLNEETTRQALELEKASKLQADFTAMIAHDLRSPLMNIMGSAEMMADGSFGVVSCEQKKWLAKIRANSRTLVDLVSDFLDVSKIESGYVSVSKAEVDLKQLVKKNVEDFSVVAREKNISVRDAVEPSALTVDADYQRLNQVLSNLLSNAIKFTGDGGEVEVGTAPTKEGHVKVWVKDNGMGIPSEEIEGLFAKYRQGRNSNQVNQKGTGLGLVICKMIVEAHGGQIWVESQEQKGSTFYFSLPLDS